MATQPSPIRDILLAIGEAVKRELLRGANENGKYPLRPGSPLAASLRVEVTQARSSGGQFAGYTADSALSVYAKDYAVWLDRCRFGPLSNLLKTGASSSETGKPAALLGSASRLKAAMVGQTFRQISWHL
jgi:hypothetical protein